MPQVRQRPQRAAILHVQQPERLGPRQFRILKLVERRQFLRVHATLLRLPLRSAGFQPAFSRV